MSVISFKDLESHYGHKLVVAMYGGDANVAIECEDCNEVLLDFDNPKPSIPIDKDVAIAIENMKIDLDGESVTIYIDRGDEVEHTPVCYWNISEIEEDPSVIFSVANAMYMFYTNPKQLLERLGWKIK